MCVCVQGESGAVECMYVCVCAGGVSMCVCVQGESGKSFQEQSRTSSTAWMPPHSHSLAKKIYDRVSDLVRKENERMMKERERDQASARERKREKYAGGE
jgi:hypothetical protein